MNGVTLVACNTMHGANICKQCDGAIELIEQRVSNAVLLFIFLVLSSFGIGVKIEKIHDGR